jgi:hypothetical protein
MKISAFTFVRNAIKYDYPVVESINSILPVVDEFVVAVGNSEDGTLGLIRSINSAKIRIVETIWDDTQREGGKVLADETNKALAAVSKDADWAFYLQADEVVHEKDHAAIIAACHKYKSDKTIEGLLFKYIHFYGTYSWVGNTRNWYRNEIRIIRPHSGIYSYKDAQGFRKDGRKLNVKAIDAHIYHYGWVKPPEAQQQKQQSFNKYWHDDKWVEENIPAKAEFDYANVGSLSPFKGIHPQVMKERIASVSWQFDFDPSKVRLSFKEKLSRMIEKMTGWRFGEYKNYKKM